MHVILLILQILLTLHLDPRGYFNDVDNFAYVFRSNNHHYLYLEFLDGSNIVPGYVELVDGGGDDILASDDIKIFFVRVPTTDAYTQHAAYGVYSIEGIMIIVFFFLNMVEDTFIYLIKHQLAVLVRPFYGLTA